MPKGLRANLPLALLLATPLLLPAQVYRCEGDSGVIYSDMPCGESAEEIVLQGDVLDSRGVGSEVAPPMTDDVQIPETTQGINEFLVMLRSQREEQIGLIDTQLAQLRAQASSLEFQALDGDEQDAINRQIASLESNRASIISGYEALIEEAERRLE